MTNRRQHRHNLVGGGEYQLVTLASVLTQAGGFGRVPLAQFSAMTDVSALQDEASMAAVMEHCPFHWWPRWLRHHPSVLQGSPDPRAQQHWEPERAQTGKVTHKVTAVELDKRR